MRRPSALRCLVLAAALTAAAGGAFAASISPVKLEVQAGERAVALGVTNNSTSPVTYDVRVFKWLGTGDAGMMLEPSQSVITARPVITVPPMQTATIRLAVVARSPAPMDYYRVVLDDITPAADGSGGVRMRVLMPLQVANRAGAKGILELVDGAFENRGTASVLVTGAKRADGSLDTSAMRYVLPGERWQAPYQLKDLVWSSGIQ
jgi:hypothetical protein